MMPSRRPRARATQMNTASRMESGAEAGGVQCTAATLAALGADLAEAVGGCFERRRVDVKGLGETETFSVRAGSAEATALLKALPQPAAVEVAATARRESRHSNVSGTRPPTVPEAAPDSEDVPRRVAHRRSLSSSR